MKCWALPAWAKVVLALEGQRRPYKSHTVTWGGREEGGAVTHGVKGTAPQNTDLEIGLQGNQEGEQGLKPRETGSSRSQAVWYRKPGEYGSLVSVVGQFILG